MDTEKSLIAERAAEWLEQLEQAGPEERARFVKWLKESPQHGWEILLATSTDIALKQLVKEARLTATDIDAKASNVVPIEPRTLRDSTTGPGWLRPWVDVLTGRYRSARRLAAVAAFLAIASLMTIAIQAVSDRTISTGPGEWQTATLADGTILHAGPRTRVSVNITDRERVVRLAHGEVMVYVTKDPARPFFVRTDLATARAIGTAFAVQRTEPNRVSVTVKEGLVGVARGIRETETAPTLLASASIVLKAGEQTQVMPDGAPLRVQHVDVDRDLAWVGGRLVFNHRIAEAIRELNLRNRTQIQLLDPEIGERRIVGVFDASDPMAFAKTLEYQLPISLVDNKRGTLLLASYPKDGAGESQEPVER